LRLVGPDVSGKAITKSITYSVAPGMVLSPLAHPVAPGPAPPVSELVSGLSFATPTAGELPGRTAGTPATWRLSTPMGAVTVANAASLRGAFAVGCNGELGPFGAVNLW
jgi:hypothetical protein